MLNIIRVLKIFNILDFMVIALHSKTKRCFWNLDVQNHKISKIRDSYLVELVILRLTCVLYAFPFNSLHFMDSQAIETFGSEIACSGITKTFITKKKLGSTFLTFCQDGTLNLGQLPKVWRGWAASNRSYNSAKTWGRLTPPPPPPASRGLK